VSRTGSATERPVIAVEHLGKRFRLFERPSGRAVAWLSGGRRGRAREVWALRDVSFTVAQSECLGLIGVNGSGKSTLLKLLTGVLRETTGSCRVDGRLLALLELGTGFNPELTGRQNVLVSTQLLRFPDGYAEARMGQIEAFADIGPFFDRPMKLYSSGMSARLAFATFLYLAPDILVVDEALAVGDMFFQRKCFAVMADILKRGTTLLLVSHDMAAIAQICTRVVLLERGEIAFIGGPEEAIARFFARGAPPVEAAGLLGAAAPAGSTSADLAATLRRHSILTSRAHPEMPGLRIAAVRLLDEEGRHTGRVRAGGRIAIQLLITAEAAVSEPELELELYDRFNRLVSGVSLAALGTALPALAQGEARAVTFRLTLALEPGEYTFTLAAYDRRGAERREEWRCHDRHAGLGPLHVAWEHELLPFYGIAALDCSAELDAAPRGG
jgi:lipopolysaccharide transport system ATP-binding protein